MEGEAAAIEVGVGPGQDTALLRAKQRVDDLWGILLPTGDPLPDDVHPSEAAATERARALEASDFGRLLEALVDNGWHPITVRGTPLDSGRMARRGLRTPRRRLDRPEGQGWVLAASTDSYNSVTGEPTGTHSFLASFFPDDGSLEEGSPRSPLGGLARQDSTIDELLEMAVRDSPPARAERHADARAAYHRQARINHAAAVRQRQSVLEEMAELIDDCPDGATAIKALMDEGLLDYYAQIQIVVQEAERRLRPS